MPPEFPASCQVETALAQGALAALERGDASGHDQAIADAAARLVARGCEAIALAQFSMARARASVEARCGCPVLTTVDSAVRALRARLDAAGAFDAPPGIRV
jgi:aspartate/glutamate racemase